MSAVPDDLHSARRLIDDADVLSTLERCFRLIQDATKTSNRVGAGNGARGSLPNSMPGSASSMRASSKTFLSRFLKRSIFDMIKVRQTRLDHNLFDVIWPAMKKRNKKRGDSAPIEHEYIVNAGVVAPDFDVYVVFQEFLVPVIKDLHCIDLHNNFSPHPTMQFMPDGEQNSLNAFGNPSESLEAIDSINLDKSGKFIRECIIECSRNLDEFELPLNLNIGALEQSERVITAKLLTGEFAQAIGDKEIGDYYTMNEVLENPSEIRALLESRGLLVPLLDVNDTTEAIESNAINGKFWPYGRGVFVSHNCDLAIWINCQEHLRLFCCAHWDEASNVGTPYLKIANAMNYLGNHLEFRNSYFLGHLAARPSYLGTSLRLFLALELPHLIKEPENLRNLCNVRGLHMLPLAEAKVIRVANMQSMGINEWKVFHDFCTAVANVIQLEKDLSMENTKHIAAMLVNIFRKKKSSLGDISAN